MGRTRVVGRGPLAGAYFVKSAPISITFEVSTTPVGVSQEGGGGGRGYVRPNTVTVSSPPPPPAGASTTILPDDWPGVPLPSPPSRQSPSSMWVPILMQFDGAPLFSSFFPPAAFFPRKNTRRSAIPKIGARSAPPPHQPVSTPPPHHFPGETTLFLSPRGCRWTLPPLLTNCVQTTHNGALKRLQTTSSPGRIQ